MSVVLVEWTGGSSVSSGLKRGFECIEQIEKGVRVRCASEWKKGVRQADGTGV